MATSKGILEVNFSDGRRPDGAQFKELINSFFHKEDKVIAIPENTLLDTAPPEEPNKGNIRWNGTIFQYWDGVQWGSLGGGLSPEFNDKLIIDNDNLILNVPVGRAIVFRSTDPGGNTKDIVTFIDPGGGNRPQFIVNGQITADNVS